MGFFDWFKKPEISNNVSKVQASNIEGMNNLYSINFNENLVDFTDSWAKYTNYLSIVQDTYLKYKKKSPFGSSSVKTIVQYLAAWALKDVTIIGETPEHDEFIKNISNQVNIKKINTELATLTEIQGHTIVDIRTKTVNNELKYKFVVIPYLNYRYQLIFDNDNFYNGLQYTDKIQVTQ